MESEWYQQTFEPGWKLAVDQNEKTYYFNTVAGFRMSTSVGGKGTGYRSNLFGIDDPTNLSDRNSDSKLEEVRDWWVNSIFNRLLDMDRDGFGIIMQRLSERDLSAVVLEEGGFDHLLITMEYDPTRSKVTSLGWRDPRTEEGELMFPALFPRHIVDALKKEPDRWASQYQQTPSPATGSIFKKHWWRFYRPPGVTDLPPVRVKDENNQWVEVQAVELPETGEDFQSWDAAFKSTATSDFVCGGVLRRVGANFYVLDVDKRRLDFPQTCDAIQSMSKAWPGAVAKLVEDKANGSAIIAHLKGTVPGLIAVNPEDGKIARANAVAPLVRAGNVFLPHPRLAHWVEGFIESLGVFPNGQHDDDVDMLTQALAYKNLRVFNMEKSQVIVKPYTAPADWPRGCGVFIGANATGAVWVVKDPVSGKHFIYDEYYRKGADWMLHAAEIKRRSGAMPVVMDCPRYPDLPGFVNSYRSQGILVYSGAAEVEPVLAEVQSALAAGTLKVFEQCSRWFEELDLMTRDNTGRIVSPADWVCQGATRALWHGRAKMRGPARTSFVDRGTARGGVFR